MIIDHRLESRLDHSLQLIEAITAKHYQLHNIGGVIFFIDCQQFVAQWTILKVSQSVEIANGKFTQWMLRINLLLQDILTTATVIF